MRYYRVFIAAVASFFVLAGCSGASRGGDGDTMRDSTITDTNTHDITEEAYAWADSIVASMTLEEKGAQLLMPAIYSDTSAANIGKVRKYVEDYKVGGLLLLQGTSGEASSLIDTIQSLGKLPLWIGIDAEWGLGMRLKDAPKFPLNGNIPSGVEESRLYDYGYEVARQCRALGINMVMGPVADMVEDMKGNPIGRRSFGGDVERVTRYSDAYSRGMEAGRVMAVAKHFPGHGSAKEDSHRALSTVDKSREELEKGDLLPFKEMMANGLSGIMVGHIYCSSLDTIRRPADMSPVVMNDILRGEMGFEGLVLTDAVNMAGARGYEAWEALAAGADLVVAPEDTEKALQGILKSVEENRLTEEMLTEKCRRTLFFKYLKGVPGNKKEGSPLRTPATDSLYRSLSQN